MESRRIAVIGLDVGTTGIKGLLVSENGEILWRSEKSLELLSPVPGWAEQNPEDWWLGTLKVLDELARFAKENGYEVKAISTSGQMHSLVLVDRLGHVVYNSILWCDQRTYHECEELTEHLGGFARTIELLGNPVLPGFTAGKVLWLKKRKRGIIESTYKLMLPKDFVNYRLTGVVKTEHSDASGSAMYDIHSKDWAPEVLRVLELQRDQLPEIVSSNAPVGYIYEDVASELGLSKDVVVIAGGADNACAALGIGVTIPGRVMISLGTSGTVLAPTYSDIPDERGRVHLFAHVIENTNYYMGVMLSATHTLNWFAGLFGDEDYAEINERIEKVPAGARGIIVLPYLNGERTPHNDPDARAVVFGLSTSHNKWDVYRAIFESVAFGLRDCFEALPSNDLERIRVAGGGSKSKLWLRILASVLGRELRTVNTQEGAAYGAAILALSGVTGEKPEVIAERFVTESEVVKPGPGDDYERLFRKYRALYVSLSELFRA